MGWGTSATIGFNAGGEAFENNEYTTNAIACSSVPDSNVANVVYRLSGANSEYPPPRESSNFYLTHSVILFFCPQQKMCNSPTSH